MTPDVVRPRTFADDFRTAANVLEETPDLTLDDEMADALASLLWAAATAAERTGTVDPAALRFAPGRVADVVVEGGVVVGDRVTVHGGVVLPAGTRLDDDAVVGPGAAFAVGVPWFFAWIAAVCAAVGFGV